MGQSSSLVEDVVVEKSMRSKGIGRKMMEYAQEICGKKIVIIRCVYPVI